MTGEINQISHWLAERKYAEIYRHDLDKFYGRES
jgi:hypothetical protein